jgi:hypothetical protein
MSTRLFFLLVSLTVPFAASAADSLPSYQCVVSRYGAMEVGSNNAPLAKSKPVTVPPKPLVLETLNGKPVYAPKGPDVAVDIPGFPEHAEFSFSEYYTSTTATQTPVLTGYEFCFYADLGVDPNKETLLGSCTIIDSIPKNIMLSALGAIATQPSYSAQCQALP